MSPIFTCLLALALASPLFWILRPHRLPIDGLGAFFGLIVTGIGATMAHAAYRTDYERELVLYYDELATAEAQQP